eukprot:TRINITY_DN3935_c0_g1_i2.p2 TRINITY_DN3935_c0_g1~~TRINITY_DN3935_c0_g1_i2.p2  ORF type:complete len:136 (-),score=33.48 TRINITY_DN3935_c0_g1_i2:43-450(-)
MVVARGREREQEHCSEIERLRNRLEHLEGQDMDSRALLGALESDLATIRGLEDQVEELSPRAEESGRLKRLLAAEKEENARLRQEMAQIRAVQSRPRAQAGYSGGTVGRVRLSADRRGGMNISVLPVVEGRLNVQ